jgi:hypothetical protein
MFKKKKIKYCAFVHFINENDLDLIPDIEEKVKINNSNGFIFFKSKNGQETAINQGIYVYYIFIYLLTYLFIYL